MGIIIRAFGRPQSIGDPIPIIVELVCDNAGACRSVATFADKAGYVGCHAAAMALGWLERPSSQGRLWLCPQCSGKTKG
jgi:hypothetical protein